MGSTAQLACGRAVALLRQLCMALQKAHEIGLIHRDLKPGNVIVTCQGGRHDLAKLLDFGWCGRWARGRTGV